MRQFGSIRLGEWSRDGIILFDGAMGTELFRRTDNHLPCEELNLTEPSLVEAVHRSYLNAGADVIRTNSFGANRPMLDKYGLGDSAARINHAAVEIARQVVATTCSERDVLIAGSIGPLPFSATGSSYLADIAQRAFAEQAEALIDAGVGMLFCETFQRLNDITVLLDVISPIAANARPQVGVGVSFSPPANPDQAAILAAEFSDLILRFPVVSLVGLNCGNGPSSMLGPAAILRKRTRLPIAVLPSAGIPISEGAVLHYPCDRSEFSALALNLIGSELVQAVGGCCGTTPEYIAALAKAIAPYRAN